MEIDWSKAPEGATHWDARPHADQTWMRPNHRPGRGWDYWGVGGYWVYFGGMTDEEVSQMIARPAEPAWNGEGLPPAGEWCEILSMPEPKGSWCKGKILYISKSSCVWCWNENQIDMCANTFEMEFRQIRTPEQIEAEEREKSAYAMCAIAKSLTNVDAFKLYDALYRKQEPKPE